MQRGLDHIILSSRLQEFVSNIDIIPAVSLDLSPVTLTLSKSQNLS